MKVCVIGAGIAGLSAASALAQRHNVTVFEANNYAGGHTNTVDVHDGERRLAIDTGFIVFNEPNYPRLCALFEQLGIESRDTDMSFSVHCERNNLEWNGSSLNQVFAQRRNMFRPTHWRMLLDIQRFHRHASSQLAILDDKMTVESWLQHEGYSPAFSERYLLPLGASLWSCSALRFGEFPIRFVLEFLHNHRMLQVADRPVWKTVVGGSREYVKKLIKPFAHNLRLNTPVTSVRRLHTGVEVCTQNDGPQKFDEVILACHADQSLHLLCDADAVEREVLSAFPYQANEAVLHTDTALLPERRSAWASWNYRIPRESRDEVCVTYNMNMLQGLESNTTWCVSLNPGRAIDPTKIVRRFSYDHPLFCTGRAAAQARHHELIRRNGVSFCGAYWGYGFHEDGLSSALRVAHGFDQQLGIAA